MNSSYAENTQQLDCHLSLILSQYWSCDDTRGYIIDYNIHYINTRTIVAMSGVGQPGVWLLEYWAYPRLGRLFTSNLSKASSWPLVLFGIHVAT